MLYTYKMPTELFFGRGAAGKVGEKVLELGGKKALVVTDKGVLGAGLLGGIEESLKNSNVPYVIFDEVESDPSIETVAKGTEVLKESGCDIVIGIGGGSSMDAAKAVATMATNPGKIFDYIGIDKVKNKALPIIAIPTTSGTGSEATYWSVLTDKKTKFKTGVGGWALMPTLAIVDPLLTKTLPPKVTAFTGMDALTHAMESYVCKATQPVSEGLAIHAMKLIARSLRKAVANGDDIDAREDMIMGSLIAAMAFNVTRLGLAHALVSPLGANFNVPHGLGNAILLPHVMEFNIMAVPEKFIEIAKIFGENVDNLPQMEAAYKSVEAVKKLMKDIGITQGLEDFGVTEESLRPIAEEAYKSGNVTVNPRKSTVQDLIDITRKAMKGIK
ncbi:MAG: iron-containing alcohol dehydrogenase [Clostridia bacterium]|nr:iron-containing alcohol dehydrogenase [Clostridia bacterium]